MKDIILFGPQGSGKGTQAKILAEKYEYKILGTGAMLRAEVATGSDLGKHIASIIDPGGLVSDEIIYELLKNYTCNTPSDTPIIFDGVPRNMKQLASFQKAVQECRSNVNFLTLVIDIPREESIKRLVRRAEIEHRADDTPDAIEKRLQIYEENTKPVIDHFAKKGSLIHVDGTGTPDEVSDLIIEALEKDLA